MTVGWVMMFQLRHRERLSYLAAAVKGRGGSKRKSEDGRGRKVEGDKTKRNSSVPVGGLQRLRWGQKTDRTGRNQAVIRRHASPEDRRTKGRMHFNAHSREPPSLAHLCSTFHRLTFSPRSPRCKTLSLHQLSHTCIQMHQCFQQLHMLDLSLSLCFF